jgi:hypothetical protein
MESPPSTRTTGTAAAHEMDDIFNEGGFFVFVEGPKEHPTRPNGYSAYLPYRSWLPEKWQNPTPTRFE